MAKMGRPTKLVSKIEVPDGAATRTTTIGERIVELVGRLGMSPSLAGREAGVTAEAVWKWIRQGREHVEQRDRGKPLYAHELRLCDFVRDLDQARARYLADQFELAESIARGGLTVTEVVQEVDPTDLDEDGNAKVLKRRTKATRLLPDIKALHWNIERKSRAVDGFAPDEGFGQRTEITGADGGAVEVDATEALARALLAEAEAFALGVTEGRERAEEASRNGNG